MNLYFKNYRKNAEERFSYFSTRVREINFSVFLQKNPGYFFFVISLKDSFSIFFFYTSAQN